MKKFDKLKSGLNHLKVRSLYFTIASSGSLLTINKSQAIFPVDMPVSTFNGTNGFIITGKQSWDRIGHSVSEAGDLNGDGLNDIIIGGKLISPQNLLFAGETYVIFGSKVFPLNFNLNNLNTSFGFQITGKFAGDEAGACVSSAGDVNGDGLDDIIIGAPGASPYGVYRAGEAYVIFGNQAGFPLNFDLSGLGKNGDGFTFIGVKPLRETGRSVSSAGDLNGDGINDIIIGAPGINPVLPSPGLSYVIYGKPKFPSVLQENMLDGIEGFVIQGPQKNDRCGQTVSAAGNINGDGYDDIIVGVPQIGFGNNSNNVGQAHVIFGRENFPSLFPLPLFGQSNQTFVINGKNSYDLNGCSVGGVGDVNDDGFDDVISGAGNAPSLIGSGEAYVVYGSPKPFPTQIPAISLNGTNGFTIHGDQPYDFLSNAVDGAGDIDKDGVDDLMVGAVSASPNAYLCGRAYTIMGKAFNNLPDLYVTNLNGVNGFSISGISTNASVGYGLSKAGDFNGDGIDDVIVGSPYANDVNLHYAGQAYIILGGQ